MDNKYGRLAKNTLIFMVGNFGSKLISFIIVPFYTFVLTTEQYGTIDLFTTIINILLPFLILGLNEAALRFLVGKEINKEIVATNCFTVYLIETLIVCLLYPFYSKIGALKEYSIHFLILLILMSFNQIFLQYLRGIGKNAAFSANGIIITLITVTSNLVFLLYFQMGIDGYFYSMILAQFIGAIQIIINSQLWRVIRRKYFNFSLLKIMVKYSSPLIFNSLMWWIMSASDKFMINFFIDTSANGVYSVAHKFPTLINLVYSIFLQAWQISAIEEGKSKDRTQFYNAIYRYVLMVLVLAASVIIMSTKPLYLTVMSPDFKIAWQSVPLLVVAGVFSCLTGFFGTVYVVNKQSKKAFSTTLIGAVGNLVFNFFLIPKFGIIGAAMGTMLGYLLSCIVRGFDAHKSMNIDLKSKKLIISCFILLLQYMILYWDNSIVVYSLETVFVFLEILIFKSEIMEVRTEIKNIVHNMSGYKQKRSS